MEEIRIQFDTDNDAFKEPFKDGEMAKVVAKLAQHLKHGERPTNIYDTNGVGVKIIYSQLDS
ncbi:hypothetical protein ACFX4N_23920 [Priestia sp. YIM B13551]|uniref:hypothetical protein n=1 Tax=Priestia sp. YIM B13551 TaxID=3366306 RepID=UPI0036713659